MSHLAPQFRFGTTTETHPYTAFAGALMLAGFAWMALLWILPRLKHPKRWALAAIALGLVFRAISFGDVSIYEDDWARYLWDGALVADGQNPYVHAPADIGADHVLAPDSEAGQRTLARINNPSLTTIYPPTAQAAFATAHIAAPFSLDGLRALWLLSDAIAMALMMGALAAWGRSSVWVVLYALNPLLIVTGFNSAHMDVLLTPFLMGALWLAAPSARSLWRGLGTSYLLALAVGVKLWPLILAPVLLRPWRDRFPLYLALGTFTGALSLLLVWPMLGALGANSGLEAYATGWRNSAFLFRGLETVFGATGGRVLVALAVCLLALALGLFTKHERDIPTDALILTAALLFLSPTGYPWYGIWILALLPFRPLAGLALLSVLTPLYYVRFALGEAGTYSIYTDILVPLQYGLPLLVLAFATLKRARA